MDGSTDEMCLAFECLGVEVLACRPARKTGCLSICLTVGVGACVRVFAVKRHKKGMDKG